MSHNDKKNHNWKVGHSSFSRMRVKVLPKGAEFNKGNTLGVKRVSRVEDGMGDWYEKQGYSFLSFSLSPIFFLSIYIFRLFVALKAGSQEIPQGQSESPIYHFLFLLTLSLCFFEASFFSIALRATLRSLLSCCVSINIAVCCPFISSSIRNCGA
jgi:hypothetical protein